MKMKAFVLCAAALYAAYGAEWIENSPAANWQESSLTGNGTIGATVEGRIENESIHLSHCKLYLPERGTTSFRPLEATMCRTSRDSGPERGARRGSRASR
jgi:hypothetical protein